jgi:hypothetical protein
MSHVDEKRQPEVLLDWCLQALRVSSSESPRSLEFREDVAYPEVTA